MGMGMGMGMGMCPRLPVCRVQAWDRDVLYSLPSPAGLPVRPAVSLVMPRFRFRLDGSRRTAAAAWPRRLFRRTAVPGVESRATYRPSPESAAALRPLHPVRPHHLARPASIAAAATCARAGVWCGARAGSRRAACARWCRLAACARWCRLAAGRNGVLVSCAGRATRPPVWYCPLFGVKQRDRPAPRVSAPHAAHG
jgi:hypothetical protein